jgi:predicted ATPase
MSGPYIRPTLVGRERELAVLEAALESSVRGAPTSVIMGGEAGVGKTRLIEEFTQRSQRCGALALADGCIDLSEGALPYAPITEALRMLSHTRDAAGLERMLGTSLTELASLIPDWDSGWEPSHRPLRGELARARAFELLFSLFSRLGEEAPVVLIIEDLHWSDASTRDLLAFLIHNLRSDRIAPVLTYRTDELGALHPLRSWLTQVRRERRVEGLDVSPLTDLPRWCCCQAWMTLQTRSSSAKSPIVPREIGSSRRNSCRRPRAAALMSSPKP